MGVFREWLNKERGNKLVAMRRWLWNQHHGHKKTDPPVSDSDPDYEWIKMRLDRLGPLDPNQYWEPKN